MKKYFYILWLFLAGCASKAVQADLPKPSVLLGATSAQALRVRASSGPATFAQRFEFRNGDWVPLEKAFPVSVGTRGTITKSKKKEGDKRTPEGQYFFMEAFSRDEQSSLRLPVQKITEQDKWIDDPEHKDYNRWVRGPTTAKSYEELWRKDPLYDLFLVTDFNTNPATPYQGSAIFIHRWCDQSYGTAGCVAMDKDRLQELAEWLDPKLKPVILIGETK